MPLFVFRRMMIEKIASHLADFSPRLRSNTRALYQVVLIVVVLTSCIVALLLIDTANLMDTPIIIIYYPTYRKYRMSKTGNK